MAIMLFIPPNEYFFCEHKIGFANYVSEATLFTQSVSIYAWQLLDDIEAH